MLSCTPVEQISGKVRLVLCLQWSSHCRIGEFNNGKDQLDVYGNSTMLHALDHFPMLTTGSLSSFKDRKTNLLAHQINKLTVFFFQCIMVFEKWCLFIYQAITLTVTSSEGTTYISLKVVSERPMTFTDHHSETTTSDFTRKDHTILLCWQSV